jgi:hypothetical protein
VRTRRAGSGLPIEFSELLDNLPMADCMEDSLSHVFVITIDDVVVLSENMMQRRANLIYSSSVVDVVDGLRTRLCEIFNVAEFCVLHRRIVSFICLGVSSSASRASRVLVISCLRLTFVCVCLSSDSFVCLLHPCFVGLGHAMKNSFYSGF